MRLREKVRPPIRFEDEHVTAHVPKKKQLQIPAFPELMAQHVVQFDDRATPAAFPSLPLNGPAPIAPSRIEAITHMDDDEGLHRQSDLEAENNEADDIDLQQLAATEGHDTLTWGSLELAVQHRTWVSLRHDKSQDYARNLLGLTRDELHNIRVATIHRQRNPHDSTRLLATCDCIEDFDGSFLTSITPLLLLAQQYELAFPLQIMRGIRFLANKGLDVGLLGSWCPDPEGSGYFKAVSDTFHSHSMQDTVNDDSGYSSMSENGQAQQVVTVQDPSHARSSISEQDSVRPPSDAAYRQHLQARAAQLRLGRSTGRTSPQVVPQNRPNQASQVPTSFRPVVWTDRRDMRTKHPRRKLLLDSGIEPIFRPRSPSISSSPEPETPVRSESELSPPRAIPVVEQQSSQVATQPSRSKPESSASRLIPSAQQSLPEESAQPAQPTPPVHPLDALPALEEASSRASFQPVQPLDAILPVGETSSQAFTHSVQPALASISSQAVTQQVQATPQSTTPVGDRSSGSMSLRSRDSLRETQAMATSKENAKFWEGRHDKDSPTESDDDIATPPATGQRLISLRIDDKSALATIVNGEKRSQADKLGCEPHVVIISSRLNAAAEGKRHAMSPAVSVIVDEPYLYASFFSHPEFPKEEKRRLLSIPLERRGLVEMWLIYGKNTWQPESPWNIGKDGPRFKSPLGAMLNRNDAGSLSLRTLIDEWNRSQNYGIGQDVVEETTICISLLRFINEMGQINQQKASLADDESVLTESGHKGGDQIDANQLYHNAVQPCLTTVKRELDQVYKQKLAEQGKSMPDTEFRTPSLVQYDLEVSEAFGAGDKSIAPTLATVAKTPEQILPKQTSHDFAMKLIDSPNTDDMVPKTPSENDLGIFGDDAGVPLSPYQDRLKPDSTEHTNIGDGNATLALTTYEKGSPREERYGKSTRLFFDSEADIGRGTSSTKAGNTTMIESPPASNEFTSKELAPPATPSKKTKPSPRRPSWSPISENEEFHSAPNTPIQQSIPAEIRNEEVKVQNIDSGLGTRKQIMPSPPQHMNSEDFILPSVESDDSRQQDKNEASSNGATSKIKLKLRNSMIHESTPPTPPNPVVIIAAKSSKNNTKSTFAGKGTASVEGEEPRTAEPTRRETRSMTSTPVPGAMPPPSTTKIDKKRKAAPTANTQSKTAKAKVVAMSVQTQQIEDEGAVGTPATSTAKPARKTGQAKVAAKAKLGTPNSRGKRGPYKKTREKIARELREMTMTESSGDNRVVNEAEAAQGKDVEMTG